jgi:hypothetical protein
MEASSRCGFSGAAWDGSRGARPLRRAVWIVSQDLVHGPSKVATRPVEAESGHSSFAPSAELGSSVITWLSPPVNAAHS